MIRSFQVHAADSSEMQLNALQNGVRAVQRSGYNNNDQGGDNRLIYNGQFVPQSVESQLVPWHSSEYPALPPMPEDCVNQGRPRTDEKGADHFYDLDTSELDPKRLRLMDGYDIALAVMEIPRTYQKALALPDAAKWKEAIDREISSHSSTHSWDALRRPHGARVIG